MDTSFNRGSVSFEDSDVADLLNYNNSIAKEVSIEESVEIRSGKNKSLIGVTLNHIIDTSVYIEDENSLLAMSSFESTSGNLLDFVDITDDEDANKSQVSSRLNKNLKCKLIECGKKESGIKSFRKKPSTKNKSKGKNVLRLVLPPISPDCYEKNKENGKFYLKPCKVGLVDVKLDTKDGRTLACARLVEDSTVKTLNSKAKLKSNSLPNLIIEQPSSSLKKETSIPSSDTVDTSLTISSQIKTVSNKSNLNISSSSNEEDILFGAPVANTLVSDRIFSSLFESTTVPLIENNFEFDPDGVNHCDLNDDSLVSHEVEVVEESAGYNMEDHFPAIPDESSTNFVNTDNVSTLSCATPLTLQPLSAEFTSEVNEVKLCPERNISKKTALGSFIERDVLENHHQVFSYQIQNDSTEPVPSVSNHHNNVSSNDENNLPPSKLNEIIAADINVVNVECIQTDGSLHYEPTFSTHHGSNASYQSQVVNEDNKSSNVYVPLVTNQIKNEDNVPFRPILDLGENEVPVKYQKPVLTSIKKKSRLEESEDNVISNKQESQINVDNVDESESQAVVNNSVNDSGIVTLKISKNNTILDSKSMIIPIEACKSEEINKNCEHLNETISSESITTRNDSKHNITDNQQKVVDPSESILDVKSIDKTLKTHQDQCIYSIGNNKSQSDLKIDPIVSNTAEANVKAIENLTNFVNIDNVSTLSCATPSTFPTVTLHPLSAEFISEGNEEKLCSERKNPKKTTLRSFIERDVLELIKDDHEVFCQIENHGNEPIPSSSNYHSNVTSNDENYSPTSKLNDTIPTSINVSSVECIQTDARIQDESTFSTNHQGSEASYQIHVVNEDDKSSKPYLLSVSNQITNEEDVPVRKPTGLSMPIIDLGEDEKQYPPIKPVLTKYTKRKKPSKVKESEADIISNKLEPQLNVDIVNKNESKSVVNSSVNVSGTVTLKSSTNNTILETKTVINPIEATKNEEDKVSEREINKNCEHLNETITPNINNSPESITTRNDSLDTIIDNQQKVVLDSSKYVFNAKSIEPSLKIPQDQCISPINNSKSYVHLKTPTVTSEIDIFSENVIDNQHNVLDFSTKYSNSNEDKTTEYQQINIPVIDNNDNNSTVIHNSGCLNQNPIKHREEKLHLSDLIETCSLAADVNCLSNSDNNVLSLVTSTPLVEDKQLDSGSSIVTTKTETDVKNESITSNTNTVKTENQQPLLKLDVTPCDSSTGFISPKHHKEDVKLQFPQQISTEFHLSANAIRDRRHSDSYLIRGKKTHNYFNRKSNSKHNIPNNSETLNEISNFEETGIHYMVPRSQRFEILNRFPDCSSVNNNSASSNYKKKSNIILQDVQNGNNCYDNILQQKSIKLRRHSMHPSFEYNSQNKLKMNNFPIDMNLAGYSSSNDESFVQLVLNKPVQIYNIAKSGKSIEEIAKRLANQPKNEIFKQSECLKTNKNDVKEKSRNVDDICEKLSKSLSNLKLKDVKNKLIDTEKLGINVISSLSKNISEATHNVKSATSTSYAETNDSSEKVFTSEKCSKSDLIPDLNLPKCIEVTVIKPSKDPAENCKKSDEANVNSNWNVSVTKLQPKKDKETIENSNFDISSKLEANQVNISQESLEYSCNITTITISSSDENSSFQNNSNPGNTFDNSSSDNVITGFPECSVNTVTDSNLQTPSSDLQIQHFNKFVENIKPINLVKKIERSTEVDFITDLNSNLNTAYSDLNFKCSISCDLIDDNLLKTLWKIKADAVKKTLNEGKKKHSTYNVREHQNCMVDEVECKASSITAHESESKQSHVEVLDDSIPLNVGLEVECCNSSSSSCLASPNSKHDLSETKSGRRKKSKPKKCLEQLSPLFNKVEEDNKDGVEIQTISDVECNRNEFKENISQKDTSSASNISNNKSVLKKKPARKGGRKKRKGKFKKVIQRRIESKTSEIDENLFPTSDHHTSHKDDELKELSSETVCEITLNNEQIIENNIPFVQEICVETSELRDMPILQAETYVPHEQSINSEPVEKVDQYHDKREMSKSPPILIKEASLSPKHDVEFSQKNFNSPTNTSPPPEVKQCNISSNTFGNESEEKLSFNESYNIPVAIPLDETIEKTITGKFKVIKPKPNGTLSLRTKTHIRGKVLAKSTNFTKTKGILHGKCFNPDLREQKIKQVPEKCFLERNILRTNGVTNSYHAVNVKLSEQLESKIDQQHNDTANIENVSSQEKKPNGIISKENILFLANDKNNRIINGSISSPDELKKKIDFPDLDAISTSAEKSAELNGIISELEETLSRLSSDLNSIDNSIVENPESDKAEKSTEIRHFIEVNKVKEDTSPALDENNLLDSIEQTEGNPTKLDNPVKKNQNILQEDVPEVVDSLLNIDKLCDTIAAENNENKSKENINKKTESIIDITHENISDGVSDQHETKLKINSCNKISKVKLDEVPSICVNSNLQCENINEEVKNLNTSESSHRNSFNLSSSKVVQEIPLKKENIFCETNLISNKLVNSIEKIGEISEISSPIGNIAGSVAEKLISDNTSTSISDKVKLVKKEICISTKEHNLRNHLEVLLKTNFHEKTGDTKEILAPITKSVNNCTSISPENLTLHVKNSSKKKIIVKRKYVKIGGAFKGLKGRTIKSKINESNIQSLDESQAKFDNLCNKPIIFTRNSKKKIESMGINFLERTETRSNASLLDNNKHLEVENVKEIKQEDSKRGRRGMKSQKKLNAEKYSKPLRGEEYLLKDQKKATSLKVTKNLLNNISPEENKHYLRPLNSDNNAVKSNSDSSLIKSNVQKRLNERLNKFGFPSHMKANTKVRNKFAKNKQRTDNSKATVSSKNISTEPTKNIEQISSSKKSIVKKRTTPPKSPKKVLRSSIRLSEKSILEDLDHRKLKELIYGAQKILNSRRMRSNSRSSGDNFVINDSRSNEELFLGMFHSEMKENSVLSDVAERITADERITAEALLTLSKIVENHDQMNNDNSIGESIYSNLDISNKLRTFMGNTLAESNGLIHMESESKLPSKALSLTENLYDDKSLLLYRNILNHPTLLNLTLFRRNHIEINEKIYSVASHALTLLKSPSHSCFAIPSTSGTSSTSIWNSQNVNSIPNINAVHVDNNYENSKSFNQLIPADMKNLINSKVFTVEQFRFLLELLQMMFIERSHSSRTASTHNDFHELLRINDIPKAITSNVDKIKNESNSTYITSVFGYNPCKHVNKITVSYRTMTNKFLSNVRSHLENDPFLLKNIIKTFPSDFLFKIFEMNADRFQSRALTYPIEESEYSTLRKQNDMDIMIFEVNDEESNNPNPNVSTDNTSKCYNNGSVISSNLKQKNSHISNKTKNCRRMSKNYFSLRKISLKNRILGKNKVTSRTRNKKIQRPKYKHLNGIVNDFDLKNLQPHIEKMSLCLSKGKMLLSLNDEKQESLVNKLDFEADTLPARSYSSANNSSQNNEISLKNKSLLNGNNQNKVKIYEKINNITKLMHFFMMNPTVPKCIHPSPNGILKDNLSVWFNKCGTSTSSCTHDVNVFHPSALHFNDDITHYFPKDKAALYDFNLNTQMSTTSLNFYNKIILSSAEMKFWFSHLKTVSNEDISSSLDKYDFYKLLISNATEGNSANFTIHARPVLNGETCVLKNKRIISRKRSSVDKFISNSLLLSLTLHDDDSIDMQTYSFEHNTTLKYVDNSLSSIYTNYFPEKKNAFEKLFERNTLNYSSLNEQCSSKSGFSEEMEKPTDKMPINLHGKFFNSFVENSSNNLDVSVLIGEETVYHSIQNKNFNKNGRNAKNEKDKNICKTMDFVQNKGIKNRLAQNSLKKIKRKEHNKSLFKKDLTMNKNSLLTMESTSKKNISNMQYNKYNRCTKTKSGVNKTHTDNLDNVMKEELTINSVNEIDQNLVNSKIRGKFSQMPVCNYVSPLRKSKLSSIIIERSFQEQFNLKYLPHICQLFMLQHNRNIFLSNICSLNSVTFSNSRNKDTSYSVFRRIMFDEFNKYRSLHMLEEYPRKNGTEVVSDKKNLIELRRFRKRKVECLKEVSPIKLSCYRGITNDTVKIQVTDAPNLIEENRLRIPIPLACHLYLEVKKLRKSVHLRKKIGEIHRQTNFGYSGNSSQILNVSSSLKSDVDIMPEESIYLSDVSTSTVSTKNEFAVKHPLALEKYVEKHNTSCKNNFNLVTINKNEILGKANGIHNKIKEVFHNSSPFEVSLSSSVKSIDVPTIIETTDIPGPSRLQVQTPSNIFSLKHILNIQPNFCQTVENSSETISVSCFNPNRKLYTIQAPRNDSYLSGPSMNSNSVTMKEIYDIYSKVSSNLLSILTNQFCSNVILPNTLNYLPIPSQVFYHENENFEDYIDDGHQVSSCSKNFSFSSKYIENNLNVKINEKPINGLKLDSNFLYDPSSELNVSSNTSASSTNPSVTKPIEDNKVNEVIDVLMQNCVKDTPHLGSNGSLQSSQNGNVKETCSNPVSQKDSVETSSSENIGSPYFSAKSPDTTIPGYHNSGELYFDCGNVEVERSGTTKKSKKEEEEHQEGDISPVDSTVEDEEESSLSSNGKKNEVISETAPLQENKSHTVQSSKADLKLSSSSAKANSSVEESKTYENLSAPVSSLFSSALKKYVNKIDVPNRINKRARDLRRKNEIIKCNTKLNPFIKLNYINIDRIDEFLREFNLKKITFPLNVSRMLQIDERKYNHTVIKKKWISFFADSEMVNSASSEILNKNNLTGELKQNESVRSGNQEGGISKPHCQYISRSVFSTKSSQDISHNVAGSSIEKDTNPNLPLKSNEPLTGTTVKRKRGRPRKVVPEEIKNKKYVNIFNENDIESTRSRSQYVTASSSTSNKHKEDEGEVSSSGLDTDCFEDSNLDCFSASTYENNYISSSDVSNLDSATDQISSTVLTPTKTKFNKGKFCKKTSEESVSSSGIRAECLEEENYSDKVCNINKRRLDFKGILSNESDENSSSTRSEGSSGNSSQLDNSITDDDNTGFNYLEFFTEKKKPKHRGIRDDVKASSSKGFVSDESHLDADDEFSCDPDFMTPLFDYSKINLQTLSEMFEKEPEENDKEETLDVSSVQSCSFLNFNLNDNTSQKDVEEDVLRSKQTSIAKRKLGKRKTKGVHLENTRRDRNNRFLVKRKVNTEQTDTTQEEQLLDEVNDEEGPRNLDEIQFKGFREEVEVCTCTRDSSNYWSCGCSRNNLRKKGLIIKFIKQLLTADTWSETEKDKNHRKSFSSVNNGTTATFLSVHSSPGANSVVQFPSSDCLEKEVDDESIVHENISKTTTKTTMSDVLLSSSPCEIMLGISQAKSLHTTVKDSIDKSVRPRKRHRSKVINSINETIVCNTNKKESFVHTIADTTRLGSSNENVTAVLGSTNERTREPFVSTNERTGYVQNAECSIPDASNAYFICHGAQSNYSKARNRKNNDNVSQPGRDVEDCWKFLLESSSSTSPSSISSDDDSDYEDYRKKLKRKRRRINS